MRRGFLLLAVLLAAAPAQAAGGQPRAELLVALDAPPLARALEQTRALTIAARRARLDLRSPTSRGYLRVLAAQQRAVEHRIARAVPGALVVRRYRVVLNALAVSVPAREAAALARVAGVASVYPSAVYQARADVRAIGAEALWGPSFSTAGSGVKIAILDDGIDPSHPFFRPAGLAAPPGFPKGPAAFTSAKIVVARAFAPRGASWRYARRPFDPVQSVHGTHVAGIAAGNFGVYSGASRTAISGAAPRAYLGNYKVLTIPTASGVGLDGNSPEIVAGIEAAVRDGMDVINLSIGEWESEPSRDAVAAALDGAAAAGVVPVVAAGNDFGDFGFGTVSSPASAARAVAVGATRDRSIVGFSSAGPTPLSHRMKPDVVAPGFQILSSIPRREGTWTELDGTSMAAPHVAGGAALLRQRHPGWTVAQIESALVTTGTAVLDNGRPAPATRAGGGRVDLVAADRPLVFAEPATLSFGLLRRGVRAARSLALADAGGGAGQWTVRVTSSGSAGVRIGAPVTVTVPGSLDLTASAPAGGREGDRSGYVVLQRAGAARRIPYWVGVTAPTLTRSGVRTLVRTGTYRGRTTGPSRVARYRYPDRIGGRLELLRGPEQVFDVRIRRRATNFGVAVLAHGAGARIEPRIVSGGDESRLTGYASLPFVMNPYLSSLYERRAVAGALLPAPGLYQVVFDTPSRRAAGRFTFRFWIDDRAPPRLRLLRHVVAGGGALVLAASDAGSGIDPASIHVTLDGHGRRAVLSRGRVRVSTAGLGPGTHRAVVRISDYQETRNNENVAAILPNTRRLTATFTIH